MPSHTFGSIKGEIRIITINSKSLEENMLGDPSSRQVAIYLPQNWKESGKEYPLFVDLVGYTGSGLHIPTGNHLQNQFLKE